MVRFSHRSTRQWLVGFIVTALLALFVSRVTASTPTEGTYPSLDPTFSGAGFDDVQAGDQLYPLDLITFDGGKTASFGFDDYIYQRLASGQSDSDFGTDGRVLLANSEGRLRPARIVRDGQGRLIVAGRWWLSGPAPEMGQTAFSLARLLPDGTLDTTFGSAGYLHFPEGSNPSGEVNGFLQQPDGKLVILTSSKNSGSNVLYRLLEDGTADPTFEGDGSVNLPVGVVNAIALQPTGILIAGVDYEGTPIGYLRRQQLSNGAVDFTFGNNGTAFVGIPGATNTTIRALTITPANDIIVAGNTNIPNESRFFAARLSADGVLDKTFGEGGIAILTTPETVSTNPTLYDAIADATGVLLIGQAGSSGGMAIPTALLAKLTPSGDVDSNFADNGFFANYVYRFERATKGVVGEDGNYLIGGERFGIAILKLSATGVPDHTYGNQGYYSLGIITPTYGGRFLTQSDGKRVIFAPLGDRTSGADATVMTRTLADGTLDTSYGNDGISTIPLPAGDAEPAIGAAMDAANRTVLAGYIGGSSGPTSAVLTRVTHNGTLDTTFGTDGFLTFGTPNQEQAHAIAIDPDQNFVVAGRLTSDTEPQALIVRRLLPDGAVDPTFGSGGATIIPDCPTEFYIPIEEHTAIHLLTDSKIIVSALCNRAEGGYHFLLYRFNADGTLDTDFGENGVVEMDFWFTDLSIAEDGTITTMGWSSTGQEYSWVAAQYTPGGDPDLTFGTDGIVRHVVPGLTERLVPTGLVKRSDGSWLLSGYNSGAWYQGDIEFAALLPDGALDTTFGTNGFARIDVVEGDFPSDIAVYDDTALLTGSFSINRHSVDVALTVVRLILDDPTPPNRTLYLPLVRYDAP